MKKSIFLVSLIIILFSGFLMIEKDEKKVISNSTKLSSNRVVIENSKPKEDEKYVLYTNVVPKVDQEYTIDLLDDIYNEEINNDDMGGEVINIDIPDIEKENEELKESNQIEEKLEIIDLEEETKEDIIEDEYVNEEELDSEYIKEENNEEKEGIQKENSNLKNGFYEEDGNTYYYENDNKITGLKQINGVNNYFSPSGKYLGTTKVKVVDVSYYQNDINWDLFASNSDCYGVILRLGYFNTLDKKFEKNLSELKRLNIPYGIYLFSYASNIDSARIEAEFTNNMIDKYDINPTLGIYYDLESWNTNSSSSDNISKNGYNYIAKGYIESVSNHVNNNYIVGIYSGRWYAMNRLGNIAKSYVKWVAEYNNELKYDGPYIMWQYTSKGNVLGIEGNVDISYLY